MAACDWLFSMHRLGSDIACRFKVSRTLTIVPILRLTCRHTAMSVSNERHRFGDKDSGGAPSAIANLW